jgi:hypothetical protein
MIAPATRSLDKVERITNLISALQPHNLFHGAAVPTRRRAFLLPLKFLLSCAPEALIRFERHRDTVGTGMPTRGTKYSNIQKAAQFVRMVRVLQFAERLGLDLPDSFAGH